MKNARRALSLSVLLVFAVAALWLLPAIALRILASSWAASGVMGDTFGITNALFSGLALAGVIYTINQQNTEISRRDAQFREDIEISKRNLDQLLLSTRYQISRDLISNNRKTISELRPDINEIPFSNDALSQLASRIMSDNSKNPKIISNNAEIISLIEEIIELQTETIDIHSKMKAVSNNPEPPHD